MLKHGKGPVVFVRPLVLHAVVFALVCPRRRAARRLPLRAFYEALGQQEQSSQSSGSNVIPRRTRPAPPCVGDTGCEDTVKQPEMWGELSDTRCEGGLDLLAPRRVVLSVNQSSAISAGT